MKLGWIQRLGGCLGTSEAVLIGNMHVQTSSDGGKRKSKGIDLTQVYLDRCLMSHLLY